MFFSFILFALIGYIPFVSAWFAFHINWNSAKKIILSLIVHFLVASVTKLFIVAIVLPEIEGLHWHSFVISLVLNSLEYFAFRRTLVSNKCKNPQKSTAVAFIWASLNAVVTSLFPFISNAQSYELESRHVTYAFSTVYSLFIWFAAKNISLKNKNQSIVSAESPIDQLFIFLIGVPSALSSLDSNPHLPGYLPHILCLLSSAIIWALSNLSLHPIQ